MTSPLLTLALLGAPTASADVVRHALIVGSNAPSNELAPLLYAEQDAARFAALLTELGGFAPEHVTVLSSPTHTELLAAIATHDELAATRDEDMFLFYYSGHADEGGLRLSTGDISFDSLRDAIRAVPSEVRLGVLDACRSGEITRLKGLAIAEPFMDEDDLSAEGEAWLTASSADESAQESDRLQGSFFTHYLVSGLRGAADTGDGVVSLDEAYTYAYDRTVARTGGTAGGTQHPSYDFRIQGKGDLPLTDVRRASARLRLPEDMAGVVTVLREPDDVPVAEVAKAEGTATVLALPPGTYRLQLRVGGTTQEGRVGLGEGADMTVPALAFARTDQQVASKGERTELGPIPDPNHIPEGWRVVDKPLPVDSEGKAGEFKPHRWLGRVAEKTGEALMASGARIEEIGRKHDGEADVEAEVEVEVDEDGGTDDEYEAEFEEEFEVETEREADAEASEDTAAEAAVLTPGPPSQQTNSASLDRSVAGGASELAPDAPQSSWEAIPPQAPALSPEDAAPERRSGGLDLRHSPVLAASASTILPGAGQGYNGQWFKGGGFVLAWAAATGGSFSVAGSQGGDVDTFGRGLFSGPTPGLMIAQMFRGWAAADAWQFHKAESQRPVSGVAVTYSTAWRAAGQGDPVINGDLALAGTGIAVDWVMEPGFSLGLDRTGYITRKNGTVIFDTGLRMTFAFFERSRLRPGLFVYGGLEVDTAETEGLPMAALAGAGGNLRWYLTPRYFVEAEGRGGVRDANTVWSSGAGLGVHFGRPGQGLVAAD